MYACMYVGMYVAHLPTYIPTQIAGYLIEQQNAKVDAFNKKLAMSIFSGVGR